MAQRGRGGGGWWEISEDAVRIRAWYGSYQADQCKERMCEINTIWCPRRRNYFQLRAQRASLRLVRDAKDPLTFVEVAQLRGTPVSAAVDFGALSLRGLLFLAEVTELATLCMLSVGAKKTKDSPSLGPNVYEQTYTYMLKPLTSYTCRVYLASLYSTRVVYIDTYMMSVYRVCIACKQYVFMIYIHFHIL